MSRRSYSDEEKAAALLALEANGGDVARTAREIDIPWSTLKEWKVGNGVTAAVTNLRDGKREALADLLEDFAYQLVGALPSKIEGSGIKDAALALGIALDKMRLLREQPTAIAQLDAGPTDAERVAGLAALGERLRSRGAGPPAVGDGEAAPPTLQ